MNRRRFDENIVIGILSGGIVSVLSEAVQHNIVAEIGGLACLIFALGYALSVKFKKKQSIEFEQVWEENRNFIVNSFLSVVDDDFTIMNDIFERLELEGFDFNTESNEVNFGGLQNIDYNTIKERFDKFPSFQNVLGFITSKQYDAVYNYLRYSVMFSNFLEKQNYRQDLLKSREEQAKKILELFNDEINNHYALKEWKRYFIEVSK